MKFIKVENLVDTFGQANYKGLNIDLFILGSQVYSKDMSVFIGATTEEALPMNADLTEITEAEYKSQKAEIIASYPLPKEEQNAVEINTLKSDFNNAIMELSMAIAMAGTGA